MASLYAAVVVAVVVAAVFAVANVRFLRRRVWLSVRRRHSFGKSEKHNHQQRTHTCTFIY